MTDEPLDPSRLITSAALDNEVTPDERALIDASPELTEEVAFYGELRARLADVDVPAASRETAIAAALEVFDFPAIAEVADDQPDAPVVSIDDRRRRQYRWLAGAAAAAVVAIVGIGLLVQNRGDDNDASTALAPSAATSESASKAPALEATTGGVEASTAYDSSAADAAATTTAPAAGAGEAAPPELTSIDQAATVSPWFGALSFDSADQLSEFVASPEFGATASSNTAPASESTAAADTESPDDGGDGDAAAQRNAYSAHCGIDPAKPSALVVYVGQNVLVVRDDDANEAIVYDPDTCRIVTTIDLG